MERDEERKHAVLSLRLGELEIQVAKQGALAGPGLAHQEHRLAGGRVHERFEVVEGLLFRLLFVAGKLEAERDEALVQLEGRLPPFFDACVAIPVGGRARRGVGRVFGRLGDGAQAIDERGAVLRVGVRGLAGQDEGTSSEVSPSRITGRNRLGLL